jgi:photosystem II stability/assembly factor-like uncharacterized protein
VLAASSGAGFLDRSADAGRRWKVTTLDDGGAGLSDLAFVNPSVGVVVNGRLSSSPFPDRLLMTHDGGLTVSAVTIAGRAPPPSRPIGPNAI